MEPDNETPTVALRALLSMRLTSGDATQIRRLALLRAAEELLNCLRVCPECQGKGEYDEPGYCSYCGVTCANCSDRVGRECEGCEGTGETACSRGEVYALKSTEVYKLLKEALAHSA